MSDRTASHAALMNETYRHQRLIYDLTRAWFLFGRDHLIRDLAPSEDARILEVACGTGRNLREIGRRWPGRHLYGFDISSEMLRTARAKLGDGATLAEADATRFEPGPLLGADAFDRIVLSYCLSMIPDWEAAVSEAARHLAPGGSLHVVDFGDQRDLPGWFRSALRSWIGRFHVTPRDALGEVLDRTASKVGGTATVRPLHRGYARYGVLRLP
jgi:S-adenosylmethionine-diacylgycerolhomoserine-N-methlytransferase